MPAVASSKSRLRCPFLPRGRQRIGLQPQRASSGGRIDTSFFPPRGFIATAMDLAMMAATQRNDKFVAHLAPERTVLREPKVMRVRRLAPANQTRLLGHEFAVGLVPKPTRLRYASRVLSMRLEADPSLGFASRGRCGKRLWLGSEDDIGVSLCSPMALPRVPIFAAKASSTCRASAAARLFFAAMIRCAHVAAASTELKQSTSVRS